MAASPIEDCGESATLAEVRTAHVVAARCMPMNLPPTHNGYVSPGEVPTAHSVAISTVPAQRLTPTAANSGDYAGFADVHAAHAVAASSVPMPRPTSHGG